MDIVKYLRHTVLVYHGEPWRVCRAANRIVKIVSKGVPYPERNVLEARTLSRIADISTADLPEAMRLVDDFQHWRTFSVQRRIGDVLYKGANFMITESDVDDAMTEATERFKRLWQGEYDADLARWRDSDGRLVREDWIRAWRRRSIERRFEETDSLAEAVHDPEFMAQQRQMGTDAWREAMKEQVKAEYIRQYLAAKPRDEMGPGDWGRIGGLLRGQYNYLDGFASEVARGRLSEAQIKARSRMYLRGAKQAYERANLEGKQSAGYREVRWVINPGLENCPDCRRFASMGWQKIEDDPFGGCVPGEGCTRCLTNCGCRLDYRKRRQSLSDVDFRRLEDFDYQPGYEESHVVELEDGTRAILKPEETGPAGIWRKTDKEELAYELSERLGFDIVPETTIRRMEDGRKASLQRWIEDTEMPNYILENDERWDKADQHRFARMRLLDAIMGNKDRHSGNWLVEDDGTIWAIDHARTFTDVTGNDVDIRLWLQDARRKWKELTGEEPDRLMGITEDDIESVRRLLEDGDFVSEVEERLSRTESNTLIDRIRSVLDVWDSEKTRAERLRDVRGE